MGHPSTSDSRMNICGFRIILFFELLSGLFYVNGLFSADGI